MTRSRLPRPTAGIAAVEFALVAPILISLLLGMADLAPSLMVRFKVGTATQSVADLATQASTMQAADVANFFAIGSDVMAPFSSTNLVLRITNVATDGNGNAFVYWSCAQGSMTPMAARSAVTSTPTGTPLANLLKLNSTLGTDTSYVMVEAKFTYTAPAAFLLRSPQVINVVAYTLPRVSTYIAGSDPNSNFTQAKPTATRYPYTIASGGVTCSLAL